MKIPGNDMIEFEEFCDLMKRHERKSRGLDRQTAETVRCHTHSRSPSPFPDQSVEPLLKSSRDLLRELFKELDSKQEGTVSVKSLKARISKMSPSLSDKEVKTLIKDTGLDSCKKLKFRGMKTFGKITFLHNLSWIFSFLSVNHA